MIDPAAVHDTVTMPAERFVYDGLVAHAMSDGVASQTLVPDPALALPRPSNGDKTYAFTLRPGIRYSTGREVHAADFRTGVLKALTVGGNREYFASIVGGRQCIDHPASCDLSAGLITDDATRRVTFNLVRPTRSSFTSWPTSSIRFRPAPRPRCRGLPCRAPGLT